MVWRWKKEVPVVISQVGLILCMLFNLLFFVMLLQLNLYIKRGLGAVLSAEFLSMLMLRAIEGG
jgi:hypothetical protein